MKCLPLKGQGWISQLCRVHVSTEAAHEDPVEALLHGGGGGDAVHDVGRDLHPRGAGHVRHRLRSLTVTLLSCDIL